MRKTLAATLVAHVLIALTWVANADHLAHGYHQPDPKPLFMRRPCQVTDGKAPWNCYYDARTMYQDGRSHQSYYQVRAHTKTGKVVCFLYWRQRVAHERNTCVRW